MTENKKDNKANQIPQAVKGVSGENLEKVRDILFGSQLKSVEDKIDQLNDNFLREIDNLREESKRRLDAHDSYLKKLDKQTSQSQRDLGQRILEQSKNLHDEILKKSGEFSEALLKAVQEIRYDMTDRKTLADLLKQMAANLEKDTEESGEKG
jgi:hypothetical protein